MARRRGRAVATLVTIGLSLTATISRAEPGVADPANWREVPSFGMSLQAEGVSARLPAAAAAAVA